MDNENYKEKIEKLERRISELEILVEQFRSEKNQSELLSFPWIGNLGQWYWLLDSNEVYFNNKKVSNLGYKAEEIPSKVKYEFFTELLHKDDLERVMGNMREHLQGKRDSYEVEYRIKAKDNTYKWYYDRGKITKRDITGKPLVVSGIVFDISKNKKIEKDLIEANSLMQELLIHDDLTHVYNRRYLLNQLELLIDNNEEGFSLILFDIDHFKAVNDKLGHDVGDKVLVEVCKVANSIVSDKGALCRFGGEEFIILLYEKNLRDSILIAEEIRTKIEKCPFNNCEKVTASFGVSTYKKGQRIDEFIKDVDSLMYLAKEHGRNCVKF